MRSQVSMIGALLMFGEAYTAQPANIDHNICNTREGAASPLIAIPDQVAC